MRDIDGGIVRWGRGWLGVQGVCLDWTSGSLRRSSRLVLYLELGVIKGYLIVRNIGFQVSRGISMRCMRYLSYVDDSACASIAR